MKRAFDFLARTADGVMVVDRRQRIVLWNEGARAILGHDPGAVLGRPCYEVVGGTDGDGCGVCRKRCLAVSTAASGGLVPTRDLEVRSRQGRPVWLNVTTVVLPSRWHELSLLVHVFRDVSSARQRSTQRERTLRKLALDGAAVPAASSGSPGPEIEELTPRESEILALLARASSTRQIARRLEISPVTVRTHVQRILAKLGVHSRLEAVTLGLRNGWV